MIWNRMLSLLNRGGPRPLQVRVDGSLSGGAVWEEGSLAPLEEAVRAVSAQRPYTFDLELSGGRYSIILVEGDLPLSAFDPDPVAALSSDLDRILCSLPPLQRTRARSSFRLLWPEDGRIKGAAFRVQPPGRIAAQVRERAEGEYDRAAAAQEARRAARRTPRRRLGWIGSALLAAFLFAAGLVAVHFFGLGTRMDRLEELLTQSLDADGFQALIRVIPDGAIDGGLLLRIEPLPGFGARLRSLRASPPSQPPPAATPPEDARALEALASGRIHLEVFDAAAVLLDRVPLDLEGLEGAASLQVRTRPILLPSAPASVRLRP